MNRVRKTGVPSPAVYLVDEAERKIYMEYLGNHALTLKEFLRQINNDWSSPIMEQIISSIAKNLAEMHKADIIHGDLTTSNMMIRPEIPTKYIFSSTQPTMPASEIILSGSIGELYFIDFGLS